MNESGPMTKEDDPRRADTPQQTTKVPESERGKEEQMPLERRKPSAVFGLVAGSYMTILLVALLVIAVIIWWMV